MIIKLGKIHGTGHKKDMHFGNATLSYNSAERLYQTHDQKLIDAQQAEKYVRKLYLVMNGQKVC